MKKFISLVFLLLILSNCKHMNSTQTQSPFETRLNPPIHPAIPSTMTLHGDSRTDDYFWLKKRDSQEVLVALNLENEYYKQLTEPFTLQREKLFLEMRGRIKEDDSSVPYFDEGYWYYTRFEVGKDYPIYARQLKTLDSKELILLDVNEIAKKQKFTSVADVDVSPSNEIMAYSVDHVGRRFFDIQFVNLKTGKPLKNKIEKTTGDFVWASDSRTLFYTRQNAETLRAERLFKFDLESGVHTEIYFERDEIFSIGLGQSKSKKYIFLFSESFDSSEVRYLPTNKPNDPFKIFLPRERKHEYSIEDGGDGFLVLTNWQAENFRLMKTSYDKTEKSFWTELIAHRPDTYLSSFQVLKSHIVLLERFNGLTQIRSLPRFELKLSHSDLVQFPDPTYVVSFGNTPDYFSESIRYSYQSMVQPSTVYDYEFKTKNSIVKKVQPSPNYNSSLYKSERLWAKAQDGTLVPISLVYRKDVFKKGQNPMLVYGYGSYGASMDAYFRNSVVSLLDRGFVYATIHVRGGSEMGRQWYEQGRMMNKKNTFTDFTDATEFLVDAGYGKADKIFASGGSAGGLLMGAILNLKPELYRGLIFDVPFVDVLTTMLDPDIPLTTAEYEQWGNPNEKAAYDYIKSYSPYDQLRKVNYPHVFVSTGYHDSQVQYWEPAKFVAKLRALSTSKNPVLFRIDMDAGHGGASGRFDALKDVAHEFSFILQLAEIKD